MASGLLPPLKPIPIKERVSVIFVEKGEIDVLDGAFVVIDVTRHPHACPGGRRLQNARRENVEGVPHARGDEP